MLTSEQILTAQKSNIEVLFGLQSTAFEGVEKLVALNLQTVKAAMTEAAETTRAALSVRDAQEFIALQAGLLQPTAERVAAYGRHVYEIAAETSAEVRKVAESTVAEAQAKFLAVIDTAVQNAPVGTESLAAFIKTAVAGATNAIDGMQKAAKQATDVAEANMQALSSNVTRLNGTKAKRA